MKKLLLTASALVLVAAFANSANAECNGFYGAIRGGVVKHDIGGEIQDDLDKNRLMLSGAIGYRYDYFRTELEYVWRKYNNRKMPDMNLNTNFKTYSFMWNVYYDIMPFNWWTPYVNAGLGLSKLRYWEYDDFAVNKDVKTRKFTWSLGAGLSLKVTNRWNIDAGYRYYDMNKLSGDGDVDAQEIYAGIRYVF